MFFSGTLLQDNLQAPWADHRGTLIHDCEIGGAFTLSPKIWVPPKKTFGESKHSKIGSKFNEVGPITLGPVGIKSPHWLFCSPSA